MATCISHSATETEALGRAWGEEATPGWVVGLVGDLGAGKTQLIRGMARGLGSPERVSSPTFVLVNLYDQGRLPFYHIDLYRLETPEAIARAGLDDYLEHKGVTVIEWMDRWPECRPPHYRHVIIEIIDETMRRITYEDFSP